MKLSYPPGATPLDPEWARDLIPLLSTMAELNEFEEQNILAALQWALKRARFSTELLTVDGLMRLHRQMFNDVWRWAGSFRTCNLNMGIEWALISTQAKILCDDVQFWIDNQTYPWAELAVRFHHRLVSIHPFINGNGRHARLAADLLLAHHAQPMLPWGRADLVSDGSPRQAYLEALRAADTRDLGPLVAFAQSGG